MTDYKLVSMAGSEAILSPVLDVLGTGVAVVTVDAKLIYANSAAVVSLKKTDWLLEDSTVVNRVEAANNAWRRMLRNTATEQKAQIFEVQCPTHASFIVTHPLKVQGQDWIVVHFEPIAAGRSEAARLMGQYYKLTQSEITVLHQLSLGESRTVIAKEQGVALSTVETHVAMIRSKTECKSVNAVLAKLARFPALRLFATRTDFANMGA